ncbi:lysozyme inhibitor LprI family protein [Xenorhabdus szentirmaii]|uniref:lysozyme inhibitor LprI family protein n=1 Tax=Xenorhabdus szentirmaii TaxID=290112 RepID=UPI0019A9024F|nr:lysozyme inhibitor LprI family protein [Xenorhabdus sp. 38]MBD2781052.1 DUF1311 domain-containing protein [Xenorhabdus sp. 38]
MRSAMFFLLFFSISCFAENGFSEGMCSDIDNSDQVYLCSTKKLSESDMILNNEYKELISNINYEYKRDEKLRKEYIHKLKLAQRAWISFRDKNCDVKAFQIESQSQTYETLINDCKNKMTLARIEEIKELK